jgi:ABC-type microcin C transport system permease subunit YejE
MSGLGKRVSFLILIGNRSVGIWSLLPVLCWAVFVAVHFMSDPSNVSINPKPLTSWLNLVLMRRTESYYRCALWQSNISIT